ncbi:MAG: diguanylate cyclase [Sulfuricella sp.]
MPSSRASTSFLLKTLHELDAGSTSHTSWLKDLHRALVCGGGANPADMLTDAHCRCKFGQWYYQRDYPELQEGPWFEKMGSFHKSMHDNARLLLNRRENGQPVSADEYDEFMDLSIRFKLEMSGLQTSIISKMCLVDHLTGVWNRNGMLHKLQQEHERMARSGAVCCVCMMDLDHFKRVNDDYGHMAGDTVLHETIGFFHDKLRKYDAIFRYGGEEFLFCLPSSNAQDVVKTMERLCAELAAHPIALKDKGTIHVTASFGVAVMSPDEAVEDTIEKADHALLCAKASGRNQVCLWDCLGENPCTDCA